MNGRLEIDNNQVENRIRPAKLGMKNCLRCTPAMRLAPAVSSRRPLALPCLWLFNGSFEAGANNALAHTLLTNGRTHGLDPENYLAEVIRRLPHDATVEQAAPLTPARIAPDREAAGTKTGPAA